MRQFRADIGSVDVLIGIASYNNARTIRHVTEAADAGLAKYFSSERGVIVNSDGGSTDGTPDIVRSAAIDHRAIFVPHPTYTVHRITTPYLGIPGKGSALRTIFQAAVDLGAKACCVVDADLRSITPEWIDLLINPIKKGGFDFVSPLYTRHKYDGTITNSIIYPITRALYGLKIRQPIGGDFGFSGELAKFYLTQDVWESDIARFGIDIWMTTEAVAEGFKVCQSYLGAKIHDPKDPGADLSDMFLQVVGSLIKLTEAHHHKWKGVKGTAETPVFGFRYFVAVEPIRVDLDGILAKFRTGAKNLHEVWSGFLGKDIAERIIEVSNQPQRPHFPNELWVSVIYRAILAHRKRLLPIEHILRSLVPVYFGRTASFFIEVEKLGSHEAEEKVEELCLEFERQKPWLAEHW